MTSLLSTEEVQKAKELIGQEGTSVVLMKDEKILHQKDGRGIRPLLDLYEEEPEDFQGSIIIDRLIGKAAAMIVHAGGAQAVYGYTMSEGAISYLEGKIPYAFHEKVHVIKNSDGTDLCPMEKTVQDITDPYEGIKELRNTLMRLQQNKRDAK